MNRTVLSWIKKVLFRHRIFAAVILTIFTSAVQFNLVGPVAWSEPARQPMDAIGLTERQFERAMFRQSNAFEPNVWHSHVRKWDSDWRLQILTRSGESALHLEIAAGILHLRELVDLDFEFTDIDSGIDADVNVFVVVYQDVSDVKEVVEGWHAKFGSEFWEHIDKNNGIPEGLSCTSEVYTDNSVAGRLAFAMIFIPIELQDDAAITCFVREAYRALGIPGMNDSLLSLKFESIFIPEFGRETVIIVRNSGQSDELLRFLYRKDIRPGEKRNVVT